MSSHISDPPDPSHLPLNAIRDEVLIAIYLRVSTDEQARGQQGLQGQLYDCQRFAKEMFPLGRVVKVYSDEGISADKTEIYERFELTQMMVDAKKEKFNVIICVRSDRLARNVKQAETVYGQMDFLGVQVWEASTGKKLNQANAGDKLYRQMTQSFAEYEVEVTRQRIKATKAGQKAKGLFSGGDIPYGYIWNTEEKKIEQVQEEIQVYLQIIGKYLFENKGTVVIARELNEAGIPLRTGRKTRMGASLWSPDNIRALLQNPFFTGYFPTNVIKRYKDESGKRRVHRNNPREWKLQVTDLIPPVINVEMWHQILDKLESKRTSTTPARSMTTTWLLTGVLKCKHCGSLMRTKNNGKKRKSTGEPYRHYVCPNSLCTAPQKSIDKKIVENKVISDLRGKLLQITNMDEVIKLAKIKIENDYGRLDNDIEVLKMEVKEWQKKMARNRQYYDEERISPETYEEERERYQKAIADRENKIKEKMLLQEESMQELVDVQATLNALDELNFGLDDNDPVFNQRKRAIILLLVDYIEFHADNAEIFLRAETGSPVPKHLQHSFNTQSHALFKEIVSGNMEVSATGQELVSSMLRKHGLLLLPVYCFE